MSESDATNELTQLQKAEYAAQRFAELGYRDCSAWTVTIKKTYGVRSLFRDVRSNLIQEMVAERSREQIRESIQVVADGGYTQFTPDEAYLIAQSLRPQEC